MVVAAVCLPLTFSDLPLLGLPFLFAKADRWAGGLRWP
jgi:hypothetical protein